MRRRLFLVALVSILGCSLVYEFDTSGITEDTEVLCADGVDNDDNGLTDCHDWGCLDRRVCCTIPTVLVKDDFEAEACALEPCSAPDPECDALDESVWQVWGAPLPTLCDGALAPRKVEQCYDVGALARPGFSLRPGVVARIGIVGRPETEGPRAARVPLQPEIVGSIDVCGTVVGPEPVVSARAVASAGGYRVVARFDGRDIGASYEVPGEARHEIEIAVRGDRRVYYSLNGLIFAISPAERPVPESSAEVRLFLAGRGLGARFEDASVMVGTRCDAPSAWTSTSEEPVFTETVDDTAWDGFSVYAPSVVSRPDGETWLFYGGCREQLGECDPVIAALGQAVAERGQPFERPGSCGWVGGAQFLCEGGVVNPFRDRFNNIYDAAVGQTESGLLAYPSQRRGGEEIVTLEERGGQWMVRGGAADRVRRGEEGAWDAAEVCCPTFVHTRAQVMMWYAGRERPGGPWRIGLATSRDGVTFEKHPQSPVLTEGPVGAFDDGGVGSPHVVFDEARGLYRLWYESRGFFGKSGVGYAVSTDGVRWHKYPQNPVVTADLVGLRSIGAPAVVLEDGSLSLWVEGEAHDRPGLRIYQLQNEGRDVDAPETPKSDAGP